MLVNPTSFKIVLPEGMKSVEDYHPIASQGVDAANVEQEEVDPLIVLVADSHLGDDMKERLHA